MGCAALDAHRFGGEGLRFSWLFVNSTVCSAEMLER